MVLATPAFRDPLKRCVGDAIRANSATTDDWEEQAQACLSRLRQVLATFPEDHLRTCIALLETALTTTSSRREAVLQALRTVERLLLEGAPPAGRAPSAPRR
jgi:hypothetical protein